MNWESVAVVAAVVAVSAFVMFLLRDPPQLEFFDERAGEKYAQRKKNDRRRHVSAYALACLYAFAVLYGAGAGGFAWRGHPVIVLGLIAWFLMYWTGRMFERRWFVAQCVCFAFLAALTFLPFVAG